jgi:hypothetical protein
MLITRLLMSQTEGYDFYCGAGNLMILRARLASFHPMELPRGIGVSKILL